MSKNKNYRIWYLFSLILLIVSAVIHLTGYFTNMLYILAWMLWMPVIALFLVFVFDIRDMDKRMRNKLLSKSGIKNIYAILVAVTAVYVIFNFVYNLFLLGSVSDIQMAEGIYYAIDADNKMTVISYEEYVKYALAGFRFLSGHSLVFIAIPLWYFAERKKMSKEV